MRKEFVIPGLAAAAGAAGFFLRRWELASAFEEGSGLPIPGAPATLALIALSAVMALAALLLSLGKHSVFPGGYDQAFQAGGNTVYVAAMVLASFLLLGAGVLLLIALPGEYVELSHGYKGGSLISLLPKGGLAVLCVLSCPGLLSMSKNNYRREGRGKFSFALLAPAYVCCVWLIVAYQQRAADPVRLDYVYQLFAIAATLLGFYFSAGFSFERPKVGQTVFFSAMSIYFSLVTLADGHGLPGTLLYVALALCLAANMAVLLVNDRIFRDVKPEPPAPPAPEGDQLTGDTQTEIELEFGYDPEEEDTEREDRYYE